MNAETVLAMLQRHGVGAEEVEGRVKLVGASRLPPELLDCARAVRSDLAKLLARSRIGDGARVVAAGPSPAPIGLTPCAPAQALIRHSYSTSSVSSRNPHASNLQRRIDNYRADRLARSKTHHNKNATAFELQRHWHQPIVKLKRVAQPKETPRLDWWQQPVSGWKEGKLRISRIVTGETFEIDLHAQPAPRYFRFRR